jgi:Dyp-type peroxidase family
VIGEPVLAVDDIQGMIAPGYRKPKQNLLHFRIADFASVRRWLGSLTLTSARRTQEQHGRFKQLTALLGHEPPDFGAVFQACALSANGLRQLMGDKAVADFADMPFKAGLAERSGILGDPATGAGSPAQWVVGGDNPVDVMLVVAGDDETRVEATTQALLDAAATNGLSNIHIDRGRERMGEEAGHEQFGFKDGVSRPALRGRNSDAQDDFFEPREANAPDYGGSNALPFAGPGRPLLWPGQILFGYDEQDLNSPDRPAPSTVHTGPTWAKNGSFLVFRRLRQDVDAFNGFLDKTAQSLNEQGWKPPLTAEKAGAILVGRWRSGAPIMVSPGQDGGDAFVTNDFGFAQARTIDFPSGPIAQPEDLDGAVCPRAAHIRKVNPRDLTTDRGPAARTLARLPLRRGITYDLAQTGSPGAGVDNDKGLLFLAFHRSIEFSFEFLMTHWVRQSDAPEGDAGHDPILSSGTGRFIKLHNNGNEFRAPIPGGWVLPTGGEYFFMPGRSFFQNLDAIA